MKQKQASYLYRAALAMALCSAVAFFSFVAADPDLWGHIKFGEDLWRTKAIPETDPYSFTTGDRTWINHEWLSELISYLIYRYLGDAGLLLGKLAIGIATLAILCKVCTLRPRNAAVFGGILVLAAAVISPGFMIRPQVFSFFFFALFVALYHLFFIKQKDRLFALPLCMAAWVNLHGGFLMGWVLCAIITVWSTVSHLAWQKHRHVKRLWIWFLLTTAAVLVNPYGYKLIDFLYYAVSLHRQISEWAPIPLWDLSHPAVKIMALLFGLALMLNVLLHQTHKRAIVPAWEIVCICFTLYAAFRHERHTPFFAIAATPYLVAHMSAFLETLDAKRPARTVAAGTQKLTALLFAVIAAYMIYHGGRLYVMSGLRIIVDPATYPVAALRFIESNGIEGNLIVPFDWGEHAIWKLYPKCKVSIDGRFETAYPKSVSDDHFIAEPDSAGWKALIEKYDADILMARQNPFSQGLTASAGPWVYVYSDPISIVFLKRNAKNESVLNRFEQGKVIYPQSPPTIYFPG